MDFIVFVVSLIKIDDKIFDNKWCILEIFMMNVKINQRSRVIM